jgi:membrane-anchored glycerophosphoryl diester phosphodiesterase (GDPDase)
MKGDYQSEKMPNYNSKDVGLIERSEIKQKEPGRRRGYFILVGSYCVFELLFVGLALITLTNLFASFATTALKFSVISGFILWLLTIIVRLSEDYKDLGKKMLISTVIVVTVVWWGIFFYIIFISWLAAAIADA